MNKLIITDDEGKTTVVPLVRDEITIGRKEGNTIRLTERNISRSHARLVKANGAFVIEDLESYNGVKVNGVPIDGPRSVQDGDRISIGDYQLSLRSDRPAAGAAVPAPGQAEEPPPYPRLVMLGPPEAGREFPLEEPEILVGRTDENAIVINHRSISRSHAKLEVKDNKVRLFDLDSANGVRVNGEDYTEVELRRGDLVELGTVRLRFVAAGEVYQFDADATVQMETVPEDILADLEKRPAIPLLPLIGVIAVLGVGLLVALLFIYLPPDEEPGDEVADNVTDPTKNDTLTPVDPTGPSPAELKKRARDLLEQNEFEAAINVLGSPAVSDDAEAKQLRAKATMELEARSTWKTACQVASQDDVEGVYLTCKRIDEQSRYYRKGCCEKVAERYGREQVNKIRNLYRRRDYDQVVTLAAAMTEDDAFPEELRRDAERLGERAQNKLDSKVAVANPRDPGPKQPQPRQPSQPSPGKTPDRGTSENAISRARKAYVNKNYNECIRLMKGSRSGSAAQVLMMCYSASGNMGAACRVAERHQNASKHIRQFYFSRCR